MKQEFDRVNNSQIKNLLSLRVVEENFFVWELLVTFDTWPYINRAFKILFEFPGRYFDKSFLIARFYF